ncbi:MAG: CRP/FNR family cyclic AMP-dependent transcriptional regulator [Candidatus Latescibacterota bacterium]|jgi:CRP/FNR family cyclic AMP-dependent transcriptional regulator
MPHSFLRQIDLFAGLDESELGQLAALLRPVQYKKGAFIVLAEDTGDEFFIIRSGRVKVNIVHEDGREIILSLLGEGEVFGELSLLDGQPRSANVVTLENTELLMLRRDLFIDLVYRYPHIATAMLAELAGRLRKTDMQIEGLALMNVTSRVAKTILNLIMEQGEDREEGVVLERRPTHQELAQMAGTTRETVTRVISRLEREGYISCQGRRIVAFKETYEGE